MGEWTNIFDQQNTTSSNSTKNSKGWMVRWWPSSEARREAWPRPESVFQVKGFSAKVGFGRHLRRRHRLLPSRAAAAAAASPQPGVAHKDCRMFGALNAPVTAQSLVSSFPEVSRLRVVARGLREKSQERPARAMVRCWPPNNRYCCRKGEVQSGKKYL